jgi:hypothetical protein
MKPSGRFLMVEHRVSGTPAVLKRLKVGLLHGAIIGDSRTDGCERAAAVDRDVGAARQSASRLAYHPYRKPEISLMSTLRILCICAALGIATVASGQGRENRIYKSAVVALTQDPALRADFERQIVAKARERNYNAVTSYDLVPTVTDVASRDFVDTMLANRVDLVLLLRPAAIGPGASLDSVRKEVGAKTLTDMRKFAKKVSSSGGDDLIAVVHMAVYLFYGRDPEIISSGAIWLDEPVADRAEGISRLQDLALDNIDAARPAIRRYYRLAPVESTTR